MKLLVVDDHPVMRDGLAALLSQTGPQTSILQARDAAEAFKIVDDCPDLDLVVLDLMLPGVSGLSALAELGRRRPDLPVIVLSSSEDARDARRALAQGALGYVPKSASQRTLMSAIELVLNGEVYVPPLLMGALNDGSNSSAAAAGDGRLTLRQVEVLKLLSEGRPNKAIATALDLSEKTVKVHIGAIFKALDVINRTQAAAVGRKMGLI